MILDEIISKVLEREGSKYTDDPADRGGPTKFGITLRSWREHIGNPFVTGDDLKAINEHQARSFYRYRYIIRPNFDRIEDDHLQELVVDSGVHHGTRRAAKWLQRVVGVRQDGIIGDITLGAVNAADPRSLYLRIVSYRIRLFGRLVSRDPELAKARQAGFNLQAKFMSGWANRACAFLESAAQRLKLTNEHE